MLSVRLLTNLTAAGSIFFLSLPAFAAKPPADENILRGVGGDFKGFDPIEAGDVESAEQVSRVYEGLLEYAYLERPYKAVPRLAEAMPEISR